MNELECMRTFVKVAEVGSFAEAGRQLNTAKSAITKRISQLEEHLELQLFQRSTRRLAITEGGAVFYQRCIDILVDLDRAKSEVSQLEWSLGGAFKVSCISSFTQAYLANDLCEFQGRHPDLQIDLRQHDRYCDPVQEGFDLSIQPKGTHSAVLEEIEILPLKRLIVGSPGYFEKHGKPNSPDELKNHRLAHNSHIQPEFNLRLERGGETQSVPFIPAMLTNTIVLLHAAVKNDDCLAMMPVFYIEKEISSGDFVPVLTDYRIEKAQLCAYYRKSSFVPMKARIFLNTLKDKYSPHPPWEERILRSRPELAYALGFDRQPL